MKKIYFTALFIFLTTSIFSQQAPQNHITAKGLSVINKTKCTQYFVVLGHVYCKCNNGGAFVSEFPITIEPETETHYTINDLKGSFTNQAGIEMTRIIGHPVGYSCYNEGTIGQPCATEKSSYIYISLDTDCKPCIEPKEKALTKAEWIPAQDCDKEAQLIFTFTNP